MRQAIEYAIDKVAMGQIYGGPALKAGMIYQFRATSIKNGGSPISLTEDLKGVFVYK